MRKDQLDTFAKFVTTEDAVRCCNGRTFDVWVETTAHTAFFFITCTRCERTNPIEYTNGEILTFLRSEPDYAGPPTRSGESRFDALP